MTQALLGYGTIFQTSNNDSPETFTPFEEIFAISGPKLSTDVIDTSHEIAPLGIRERLPGFVDNGEVQIAFNFIPGSSSTAALMAELASRAIRTRQIIYPDGAIWQFAAYLSAFESAEAVGDRLTGTATYQITGAITRPPARWFTIGISEIGGPDQIKP